MIAALAISVYCVGAFVGWAFAEAHALSIDDDAERRQFYLDGAAWGWSMLWWAFALRWCARRVAAAIHARRARRVPTAGGTYR